MVPVQKVTRNEPPPYQIYIVSAGKGQGKEENLLPCSEAIPELPTWRSEASSEPNSTWMGFHS